MTLIPLRGASPAVTWAERIGTADSQGEVVSTVREYLARLTPEEVGALPESCRPARIVDAGDVASYAFELVSFRADDGATGDRIHRMASLLSLAAARLSALAASEARPPAPGSRQPAA